MGERNWAFKIVTGLLAAGAVMLSGCDDPDARAMVQTANKEISDLKGKVSALESKNDELVGKLKAVADDLRNSTNDRIDKASEKESAAIGDMLTRLEKAADETRKLAQSITDQSRTDFDASLDSARKQVAGDMSKMRDEMKATFEDLKKYMDNQLRELYPYAYQPKRLDNATPPAPETK